MMTVATVLVSVSALKQVDIFMQQFKACLTADEYYAHSICGEYISVGKTW